MGLFFMISVLDFSILDWIFVCILVFSIVISAVRGFFAKFSDWQRFSWECLLAAWGYRSVAGPFLKML